jgi:hypothetical protein
LRVFGSVKKGTPFFFSISEISRALPLFFRRVDSKLKKKMTDAFGGRRITVKPPERGVFPLDHDGECKPEMQVCFFLVFDSFV